MLRKIVRAGLWELARAANPSTTTDHPEKRKEVSISVMRAAARCLPKIDRRR